MRGATGVTIQPHQILRLSCRKTHLLNHHYIWNLIYNARSNSCHDPTSPNTAPVTQKDSYLVLITYETSFTMRGATGVTIQPHQILRLSRRKTRILSLHHIWNLIYNARSNRCHHPTSPNTAPATQKDSLTSSSLHMKPHLQCAEQQVSPSNITKYCACHAERLTYLIIITYETSFSMRGATAVTIQPHQILRLSRRKTHLLSPHRIWNVIYNARSNRCHHPTSPNTAPATQKDSLT